MAPDLYDRWGHLIDGIDKDKIPVEFVKKIVVKLRGRRQKTINVSSLLKQGLDGHEVEAVLHRQIEELEDDILHLDFLLDIEKIAETVQPETDKLLRGL